MRFSSKTFKRRSLKKVRKSRKTRKTRKLKQRGGSTVLYRGIPEEATFSDPLTGGLE
jgi:hypothetical protein